MRHPHACHLHCRSTFFCSVCPLRFLPSSHASEPFSTPDSVSCGSRVSARIPSCCVDMPCPYSPCSPLSGLPDCSRPKGENVKSNRKLKKRFDFFLKMTIFTTVLLKKNRTSSFREICVFPAPQWSFPGAPLFRLKNFVFSARSTTPLT